MQASMLKRVVLVGLLSGCADQSSIKPAEVLDERTGITVGALQEPLEFIVNAQDAIETAVEKATPAASKRVTFAYLGPIEWDQMGDISYALWLHVAPGTDRPVGDIRAPGAVTLDLADGPLVLSPIVVPSPGKVPYRPAVSWGQTSYFALDVPTLKRMANSPKFTLHIRAADGPALEFLPGQDTKTTLTEYTRARGIIGD